MFDTRNALLLGTLFETPSYSFDDRSDVIGLEGEIPEVDEGFDGLTLYYGGDLLEKTSAVEPSRMVPPLQSPADFLSLPWAASELEIYWHPEV